MRLVTFPIREDAGYSADVAAFLALKHFPASTDIQQMWVRWIYSAVFDRKPGSPFTLAKHMADARADGLSGWDPIYEAVRSHVRKRLRCGEKSNVETGIDHIRAAADRGSPALAVLLSQARGVSGTAEWDDWRRKDPKTAEWMECYLHSMAQEAAGDRDWLRALKEAKQTLEFMEERRSL